MILEYNVTSNNLEDYIVEIPFSPLCSESENKIIEHINENLFNFKSCLIPDPTKMILIDRLVNNGLSFFPILDEDSKIKIIEFINLSGIKLNFEDIIFGFERCNGAVSIHSDKFRMFTLVYFLRGNPLINFYSSTINELRKLNLKLEHSVKIKEHSWYLLNNSLFHDIEGNESLHLYFNLYCRFYDFQDAKENWKRLLLNATI